jgi:hypothetical protein
MLKPNLGWNGKVRKDQGPRPRLIRKSIYDEAQATKEAVLSQEHIPSVSLCQRERFLQARGIRDKLSREPCFEMT